MAAFDPEADRHVCGLHRALRERRYEPRPWRLRVVHDPKRRLIAAPAIVDRIVHRALVDEIGPTYERSFVDQSFACSRGRGAHRAVIAYLGAVRRHRFVLRLDVQRCFASVCHDTLFALLFRRLEDRDTRALIAQLVRSSAEVYQTELARQLLGAAERGRGLALGSYLIQWAGGFYLDGLDHFVKRELRVRAYLRYMDDFALLSDDRAEFEEAKEAIRWWLDRHRGVGLNPKHGSLVSTAEPTLGLGYRVNRAGIRPSGRMLRRLRRRLQCAAERGSDALERTVASYVGIALF